MSIAFAFSEDRTHRIVGHLDWVRMIVMMFLIPLAYLGILKLGIQKSNFEEAATMLQARMKRQELLAEDSTRVRVIKICLGLLSEPKVFVAGTGPDNMVIAYDIYGSGIKSPGHGRFPYQRSGIHNVWMKMFVEYGVISAILLIEI